MDSSPGFFGPDSPVGVKGFKKLTLEFSTQKVSWNIGDNSQKKDNNQKAEEESVGSHG